MLKFVELKAAGFSTAKASAAVGYSYAQGLKLARQDKVKRWIEELRGDLTKEFQATLVHHGKKAVEEMFRIGLDPNEDSKVKVVALKTIIETLAKITISQQQKEAMLEQMIQPVINVGVLPDGKGPDDSEPSNGN